MYIFFTVNESNIGGYGDGEAACFCSEPRNISRYPGVKPSASIDTFRSSESLRAAQDSSRARYSDERPLSSDVTWSNPQHQSKA